MRIFILIQFFLLLGFTSFSQEKIVDIEVPVASRGMFVIPLDTAGFFAIEKTGIAQSNLMVKKGYHYNTDFELVNSFFIEMDIRFGLMRFTSDATGAYFLYKKTLNKNELGVMHISPDGAIDFTTVPLDQDFVVQQFQIAGKNALIGGLLQFEPVYFLFDLEQGRLMTLPGFQNNSRTIIQSTVDDRNKIITLVTSSENKSTGQLSYDIRNYNYSGELLRDVFINPEGGRNLISALVSNFIGDSQFIYGAYVEPRMQGITGIYSIELKAAGEQKMSFTPFFQLPELYSHMPKNRAEGIVERAQKKFAKKGKWSTSERPQLYVPKLSAKNILYAFEMDMDAHENLYQIVMSRENTILNTANTELIQNNVNRYTNQNPINFVRKSNAYRVLKSGVTWEYNGKFHFAYRNGDEIHANIIDAESSEFTKHSIAQITDAKVFRNLEEKIFSWYGDKVLVATEESRPGNGIDKNRHMVITMVTVH